MNVMIYGSCLEPTDAEALWPGEEHVIVQAEHIPDLLVKLGIYKSNSEARRAGRDGPIPPGFTQIKASKKVPELTIWNPTKYIRDYDNLDASDAMATAAYASSKFLGLIRRARSLVSGQRRSAKIAYIPTEWTLDDADTGSNG